MTDSWEGDVRHFPVGAPDVRLGGLATIRSMIQETGDSDHPQGLQWHIYGVPTLVASQPVYLFGDLEVSDGQWIAATTVLTSLAPRQPGIIQAGTDEEAEAVAVVYGPWASEVLYDFAAAVLRPLIQLTFQCPLKLPDAAPEAHIASFIGHEETGGLPRVPGDQASTG